MKILRREDYKVMPWKNGGGVTTELAVHPEDSGLDGKPFQWRVSIADVAEDGPFSKFNGYDRHIMLLEGHGMRLETAEGGTIDLTEPFRPASFSGDWTVSGVLKGGPVRDFNLMVARQWGQGSLLCQVLSAPLALTGDGATRLIHCIEGELSIGGHVIGASETTILSEGESAVLSSLGADVLLAMCIIRRRSQGAHP